jgi:hypothetical protein
MRQHNGEIKGGARYTSKFGNSSWEICALIRGFPDSKNALQCEWRIKHPDNRKRRNSKYNNPKGRVKGLNEVLKLDRWTGNSTIDNGSMNLKVWILEDYVDLLNGLPGNVEIRVNDRIDLDNLG